MSFETTRNCFFVLGILSLSACFHDWDSVSTHDSGAPSDATNAPDGSDVADATVPDVQLCPTGQNMCGGSCQMDTIDHCGPSCAACPVIDGGVPICVNSQCQVQCATSGTVFNTMSRMCVPIPAPRLVAPLSTATVTHHVPRFFWANPPGVTLDAARVILCADAACTTTLFSFDAPPEGGHGMINQPIMRRGVVFWRAFGVVNGTIGTVASPTWQFHLRGLDSGTSPAPPHDTSWGTYPDLNNDGGSDLVIMNATEHTATVIFGASSVGPEPSQTISAPSAAVTGFGSNVVSAGDLNGDGYSDLAIGADALVTVFYGAAGHAVNISNPTLIAPTTGGGANFGKVTRAIGDVDGDGYGDLAAVETTPLPPHVNIYRGSANGIIGTAPYLVLSPPGVSTSFGAVADDAGDVNGDGHPDLIVADPPQNNVYLFMGTGQGFMAPVTIHSALASFPSGLRAAGDVNHDGFADFVIGTSPNFQVYLGSATGVVTTSFIQGGSFGSNYANRLTRAGDLDGDGFDDFVVGANGPAASEHAIDIYFGSANPTFLVPGVSFTDMTLAGAGGGVFAYAGDINDDHFDDIVIGLPVRGTYATILGGSDRVHGFTPALGVTMASELFGSAVALRGSFIFRPYTHN